jgi:hypothetical protein
MSNNFTFRSETSDNNDNNNEYLFNLMTTNNNKKSKSKSKLQIENTFDDSESSNNDFNLFDIKESVYTSAVDDSTVDDVEISYEDFYENDTIKENTDHDKYLFEKYFNLDKKQEKALEVRYITEISETTELYKLICKNNYNDVERYFKNGNTIFKSVKNKEGIIIKSLCVKTNCPNQNLNKHRFNSSLICKTCYKTPVYSSLKSTNRGIKTIYNYLLRLLIITKKFRVFCECCKDRTTCIYLDKMNEYFKNKKNISEIAVSLNPKKKIELEINFYINKFMKILNFLKCECKFTGYNKNYYSENFLNFSTVYEIYLTTIPNLIKLLKEYFSINENNEELYLIDDSRCIHEDIQYHSLLRYCTKKKENNIDYTQYQNELVMKIENVNKWLLNSLKINILMINEQSLELFNYELLEKNGNNYDFQKIFEKLYNRKNIFINLDHSLCEENIVNIILKSKLLKEKSIKVINNFIEQYSQRNNINEKYKKNFENVMINYAKDCIEDNNYLIGIEFLKEVKKSSNISKTHQMYIVLKCIFDKIINTNLLSNEKKISFLKIINKNKINVSEYDFVSNLIDYKHGDDIILGFDKYSNNLFKINDYTNNVHIKETIKNCVINFKSNIIDYVLYNLNKKIEFNNINPINIYLTNIKKINSTTKKFENEHKYIEILEIILKHEKNKNIDDKNIDEKTNNKYFSAIKYCIENELTESAKLFIRNKLINNKLMNEKLMSECISKNNHIIAECLIKNNPELINIKYNKINLLNIIFKNEKLQANENVQVRFIKKIISPIVNLQIDDCSLLNEDDDYNESFGFLLLSSDKISNKNKIYLINYVKNHINPMKVNLFYDKEICNKNTKNIPLILYSYLLDEYEITFILLNSLIRCDKLDKIKKDNNSIFNNYYKNDNININIIPIIIKYLKNNHDYYPDFDENNIDENTLDIDKTSIILILICLELLCGYLKIKLKYNKINEINNNKKNSVVDNNKYKEIGFNTKFNKSTLFDTDNNTTVNNTKNINNLLFDNYDDVKNNKYKKIIQANNKYISDDESDNLSNNSSNNSDDSSDSLIMKNDILF